MRADVVIVGGGLAGSAAAWALTRGAGTRKNGAGRVVLLEQFHAGHDKGSSHGSARIFRRAYPDPFYVQLTGEAGRLWAELEAEAGEQLIRRTGSLDFGPSSKPEHMYHLLRQHHVAAELLLPEQAADRWPQFVFDKDDTILYHPEGGVIDADKAIAAMQRLAQRNGAEIHHETPVTSIDTGTGRVTTATGHYDAGTVIVAAGAWLEPLLSTGLGLTVLQTQAFHHRQYGSQHGTNDTPTFIYYAQNVDDVLYGLPSGSDAPGAVKLGVHGGDETTADGRDGVPSRAAQERVQAFVMTKMRGTDPQPERAVSCLYTYAVTEDFVIDRQQRAIIVSACSGHGAKFAPLTGTLAGALAKDQASTEEHRYQRFTINHQLSARLLARTQRRS